MDPPAFSELEASVRELPPVDLDEERRRRAARHFAFRLHEVRNWIHECLPDESLPPAIELEESLRDGVLLAKLANRFAAGGGAKIFESKAGTHHFRHTDNINNWRAVCLSFQLTPSVLPDSHDVYVGRNVRTIFALVAFARRLFELRKAPPLRDQTGNVQLNERDYARLIAGIERSGTSFGFEAERRATKKPSGADVHAAFRELQAAIANGDAAEFGRLLTAGRHVLHVEAAFVPAYWTAVRESARMDTLDGIQETIVAVNRREALRRLHAALEEVPEDRALLGELLAGMNVAGGRVLEACLGVYAEEMRDFLKTNTGRLEVQDVEQIVSTINAAALVREATVGRDPARILDALRDRALELADVLREETAPDYAARLCRVYRRPNAPLLFGSDLRRLIVETNEKFEVKQEVKAEVALLRGQTDDEEYPKDQTLTVAVLLRKCVKTESRFVAPNPCGYLRYLLGTDRGLVRSELAAAYLKTLSDHYARPNVPLLHGPALKQLVLTVNKQEDEQKAEEEAHWTQMAALLRRAAAAVEKRDREQLGANLHEAVGLLNRE